MGGSNLRTTSKNLRTASAQIFKAKNQFVDESIVDGPQKRSKRVNYTALHSGDLCLVLLQVPKCFVPVQIFWASPKIWLHLVPLQKLLCQYKNQFYWMQIIFCSGTKCLWLAQYVNKFLVQHKKFGVAQNILGPVKGQGIRWLKFWSNTYSLSQRSCY